MVVGVGGWRWIPGCGNEEANTILLAISKEEGGKLMKIFGNSEKEKNSSERSRDEDASRFRFRFRIQYLLPSLLPSPIHLD
jgi:hypothetical protein